MNDKVFFATAGMGDGSKAAPRISKDGFSTHCDLDRVCGGYSRAPSTSLPARGRRAVVNAAKGGVATAWMLNEMKARGVVPAALVLNAVNPIMVQGAALADFTMISGFDIDISTGDPERALVEVDPTAERPFVPRDLIPCPRPSQPSEAARRAQHCCVHLEEISQKKCHEQRQFRTALMRRRRRSKMRSAASASR